MRIGIPRELKPREGRVGLIPAACVELVRGGHEVFVESGAGEKSGYTDRHYRDVGVQVLPDADTLFDESRMIVKVKEPIAPEYPLVRKGQLVFTYFHFASDRELTDAMLKSGAVCLAYETVQTAAERMAGRVCGSVLVCNGDRLCGIFTEHDLMTRVVGKGRRQAGKHQKQR